MLVSKVAKSEAGNNVDGINISIGNGLEARGPRALVWFQARQHAWESGGSWVADGVARYAASDAGARLRAVADVVVVRNAPGTPQEIAVMHVENRAIHHSVCVAVPAHRLQNAKVAFE